MGHGKTPPRSRCGVGGCVRASSSCAKPVVWGPIFNSASVFPKRAGGEGKKKKQGTDTEREPNIVWNGTDKKGGVGDKHTLSWKSS